MNNKKSQMRSRLENFGYALQLTMQFYPQKLMCKKKPSGKRAGAVRSGNLLRKKPQAHRIGKNG